MVLYNQGKRVIQSKVITKKSFSDVFYKV